MSAAGYREIFYMQIYRIRAKLKQLLLTGLHRLLSNYRYQGVLKLHRFSLFNDGFRRNRAENRIMVFNSQAKFLLASIGVKFYIIRITLFSWMKNHHQSITLKIGIKIFR